MHHPRLPPPFKLAVLQQGRAPLPAARARPVAHGEVLWEERPDRLAFALVLEADGADAPASGHVALLALYRALAAGLPPGVPLHVRRPPALLLDGAPLVKMVAEAEAGALRLAADVPLRGPGSPADMGAVDLDAAGLLLGFCRHLLPLGDLFAEGGLAAVAPQWNALAFGDEDRMEVGP
ncbi:MAG: hypothetical protein KDG89_01570 [Geminicoccaceae bacterium]|nr:hypothetical protein [Geminicoccaceae bacterium]